MFLLDPEGILQLLRIQLRDPLVQGVAVLILIKLWLLIALGLYVVYKRSLRLLSRWNNEKRYLNHMREIFGYVQSRGKERFIVRRYDRLFVRRLIVAQMSVMEGEDKNWLKNLYKQIGYFDEDLRALKSKLYWKRLAAVVRLEVGQFNELIEPFTKLIEDPNDFVSIVAMRALSRLEGCGPLEPILDALSRRAPSRRDVFIEILQNLGGDHPDQILSYLENCYDPQTASICIEVLGQVEYEEAFHTILRLHRSNDEGVVRAVAQALGRLRNPKALDALHILAEHENPEIRAEALRSLVALRDPRLSWLLSNLRKDQSVQVRRALFDLKLEAVSV